MNIKFPNFDLEEKQPKYKIWKYDPFVMVSDKIFLYDIYILVQYIILGSFKDERVLE